MARKGTRETERTKAAKTPFNSSEKKAVFVFAAAFARKRNAIALLRNNLDCPMENARVERCQFHSMFFD
jgi:hypothetical protein